MRKAIFGQLVRSGFIVFLNIFILASCSGGGGTPANTVPTASSVSISDDNAGSAVAGDSLTGNYTYADAEGDAEGASTFRWLRNGTAISGAKFLAGHPPLEFFNVLQPEVFKCHPPMYCYAYKILALKINRK